MIWALVLGGLALVAVGLFGLRPLRLSPRSGPRGSDFAPTNPTTEREAWEILADPVITYRTVANDHPTGTQGFRRGLSTGIGIGLLTWSLVLLVFPQQQPPKVPLTPTVQNPGGPVPQVAVPPARTASVVFTISQGELPDTIARRLTESGLVGNADLFLTRLSERELDTRLQAGSFTIRNGAALDEVIDVLTS